MRWRSSLFRQELLVYFRTRKPQLAGLLHRRPKTSGEAFDLVINATEQMTSKRDAECTRNVGRYWCVQFRLGPRSSWKNWRQSHLTWPRSSTTSFHCVRDSTFHCSSLDLKCPGSQSCWVLCLTCAAMPLKARSAPFMHDEGLHFEGPSSVPPFWQAVFFTFTRETGWSSST